MTNAKKGQTKDFAYIGVLFGLLLPSLLGKNSLMGYQKKSTEELFEEFMYECEFARKLRPETLRGYKATFLTFTKLQTNVSLDDLTPVTITRFFRQLDQRRRIVGKGTIKTGVRKSTIATYWSKLNSFFEWLRVNKHIRDNPFYSMEYPSPVYENKKFLKREEIEKIITAILSHSGNPLILKRDIALFHILLFCGLRREELALLQLRDIDLQRKIITIRAETSKSSRARTLPLHSKAILYLKDYLGERKKYTTPFLFVSSIHDDKLSYEGLRYFVHKLREHSGVRFHLHQFRHTFAVNFLKESNNIAKLKQLLGHNDIRMTMQYLRCLPTSEMRSDIECMGIDTLI